jgi:hypothetical protein
VSVLIADSVESGRRTLEDYSRANYGLPLKELETIQAVTASPPEHVASHLRRYIAAGARHLVCRIAAASLKSQRDQLAGLFPLLRRHP